MERPDPQSARGVDAFAVGHRERVRAGRARGQRVARRAADVRRGRARRVGDADPDHRGRRGSGATSSEERLADGVVAFCAELLEHPNAADVLFGGDGSGGGDGRGGGGEMGGGSGGVHATPFTARARVARRGRSRRRRRRTTTTATRTASWTSRTTTRIRTRTATTGSSRLRNPNATRRKKPRPRPAPARATETTKSPPPPPPATADAGNELGADLASFIVNALDAVTRGMDANAVRADVVLVLFVVRV